MGCVAASEFELKPVRPCPLAPLVLGSLFTFYFVMMFEGLKTLPPVPRQRVHPYAIDVNLSFGYLLLRRVTTPRMALALAIAASGALVVIFRGDISALLAFDIGRGEVIYFIGCIAHTFYTPLSPYNRGEGAAVFTCGMLIGGSVPLVLLSLPQIMATNWMALSSLVWVTIAYITLISTAAGFFLLQFAALRLPSAKVMAYTYRPQLGSSCGKLGLEVPCLQYPCWLVLWQLVLRWPCYFGRIATICRHPSG